MLKKTYQILSAIIAFSCFSFLAMAGEGYDPPFEMCGIVKNVGKDYLDVHVQHINKQMRVKVLPDTLILDRMDKENNPQTLAQIKSEDLVIIQGVVKVDNFCSKEISFLSVTLE